MEADGSRFGGQSVVAGTGDVPSIAIRIALSGCDRDLANGDRLSHQPIIGLATNRPG